MLRKRASTLLGAGKPQKTTREQKCLAPSRTLILQSPMSGSMTELNETCEFEFGHDGSQYQERTRTEPLLNETFYLPSSGEASPHATQPSMFPIWAYQQPSITVSPAEPIAVSEVPSITYKEFDTLTKETFVATTITYTRVGKANIINITMKRSRENSRTSSISTRNTIFSTYNETQSTTSTPSSSIYNQPFYSPISSPEIESKPFRNEHQRNDSAFLDSIEEPPKEFVPQSLLIKTPTFKRKEKNGSKIKTTEILPYVEMDRPSTPNKLRRSKKSVSDVWYRR